MRKKQVRSKPIELKWQCPTWLKFLVIALLALGIFFRFVNLDRKAYWFDETYTSLEISGYTDAEVEQQILDGRVISNQDLQKYQHPNSEKSAFNTLENIARKEPQLTPLYFLLARVWEELFGNSVATIRSLSAVVSLLAFPYIYWLCLELFGSPLSGWLAMALIAISPFYVLYAQEARPYSLWTVVILVSNATLLRSLRSGTRRNWGIYAATVSLGLYTYLFSVLVFTSHGIYLLIIERFRLSRTLIAYGIASSIGLISFAPWIMLALINLQKTNENRWGETRTPLLVLFKGWVRSLSLFFIDFSLNDRSSLIYFLLFLILLVIVLILVGYSIYFLVRNTQQQVWLFIVISAVVPALVLLIPDLILGGKQSTATRYLIPCFSSIQLAVVYLFAQRIFFVSTQWQHRFWRIALVALLSIGVISCADISQSAIWWNKAEGNDNYHLAQIINTANKPLLVSDAYFVRVISLSYLLTQNVQFQLVVKPNIPQIPPEFSNVFLYEPSQTLRDGLKKQYSVELIAQSTEPSYHHPSLWRLAKR